MKAFPTIDKSTDNVIKQIVDNVLLIQNNSEFIISTPPYTKIRIDDGSFDSPVHLCCCQPHYGGCQRGYSVERQNDCPGDFHVDQHSILGMF